MALKKQVKNRKTLKCSPLNEGEGQRAGSESDRRLKNAGNICDNGWLNKN